LLWEAFATSDAIGQAIVIILGFCSVISWSLMFYKASELRRVKAGARDFILRFRRSGRDPFAITVPPGEDINPAGLVYREGLAELRKQLAASPVPGRLTRRALERVEHALTGAIELTEDELKEWMVILAIFAATGPMLGIFGTVYGVLIAFMAMGESRAATIGAVAPGIAGALLTTVAGLLVAIPALIGYNMITKLTEREAGKLYRFADDFSRKTEEAYPLLDGRDEEGVAE